MKSYRVCGASLGWFAIFAQYWLNVSHQGLVTGSITYFAFFTILSNILVALAFTAPLLADGRGFFDRDDVRTALGVYIFVVAVIFYLLLRKLYHPTGLGWFVNILLHYIIPPLFILDWVVFVPKHRLRFEHIPLWLVFPLAYAFVTLLHGAASGWYPYPFLDAKSFGYPQTFINIAGLTLFFTIVSAGFVAAGRLDRRQPVRSSQ